MKCKAAAFALSASVIATPLLLAAPAMATTGSPADGRVTPRAATVKEDVSWVQVRTKDSASCQIHRDSPNHEVVTCTNINWDLFRNVVHFQMPASHGLYQFKITNTMPNDGQAVDLDVEEEGFLGVQAGPTITLPGEWSTQFDGSNVGVDHDAYGVGLSQTDAGMPTSVKSATIDITYIPPTAAK